MTLLLDTDEFPAPDRAEVVREVIAAKVVPIEIRWHHASARATARGVISDLGQLTVCSIKSTANTVERTARLARDGLEPSVFLGLQRSGSSLIVQGDREVVLTPGSLVIYDSTAPYTLIHDDGVAGDFFRVPQSALALPPDVLRDVCAVPLSPGHPITALTANHLGRLAACPELFTAPGADAVGLPSIELLRAVISIHLDATHLAGDPVQATLQLRILEYARAHLAEPDLTAERVAAEHYISVRYLYKLLAADGISLANWIRTRRLERCRTELGRPSATATSVAGVARRWGFSDMSSFSRSFRAEYGTSPRDWRDQRWAQCR